MNIIGLIVIEVIIFLIGLIVGLKIAPSEVYVISGEDEEEIKRISEKILNEKKEK